jgi:hypothetical protein
MWKEVICITQAYATLIGLRQWQTENSVRPFPNGMEPDGPSSDEVVINANYKQEAG